MFTGIIHGQGHVQNIQNMGKERRLSIHTLFPLTHIIVGESIAVNGVCLTVESGHDNTFHAYASAETIQRTNLGELYATSPVNIERALAVGDRIGGHIVSGHVDCIATVKSIENAGQSRIITLTFPEQYSPEVIAKGSVTLDGISLTVNTCGKNHLTVNVIPETWTVTTVATWKVGAQVNMETDIIGKYVRHMLNPFLSHTQEHAPHTSTVTEELLHKHGFIS